MADDPPSNDANLPAPLQVKPSLLEWMESFLPFTIPRIPLPQTAKNLDKALARVVDAGGSYYADGIDQARRFQDAQTTASIDFIKRGSREVGKRLAAGDEALSERSIAAAIGEQVRSQRNREAIAAAAAKELMHAPPTSDAAKEIDDDWLNLFASLASGKSSADMQSLWGKLLAGEIRRPGTFRLRTLQALAALDAEEAQLIHEWMAAVVDDEALFYGLDGKVVPFHVRLTLQDLGVVNETSGLHSKRTLKAGVPLQIWLGAREVLAVTSNDDEDLRINHVTRLTFFGRDLFHLAKHQRAMPGLATALAESLAGEGRTIVLCIVGELGEGGAYPIESSEQLYPALDTPNARSQAPNDDQSQDK